MSEFSSKRGFLGAINSFDGLLSRIEGFLIASLLFFILVFAFVQVVLKLMPENLGIQWLEMLLRYLVPWIGLLGGSLATRTMRHIKIDLFTKIVPARAKKWLDLAIGLFSMVVAAVLVYTAARYFLDDLRTDVSAFTFDSIGMSKNVPRWIFSSILPVSFFLVFWHLLILFANLLSPENASEGGGK